MLRLNREAWAQCLVVVLLGFLLGISLFSCCNYVSETKFFWFEFVDFSRDNMV